MACHATWPVQASVAGTAATIAALLGSLTAFESILRVPNKANVPLFRFTWMPELNDPINKLLQTIGVEVQRIIDTKMKAKITEIRPAAILFLAGHRLLIPEGEAAIFFPLPIPMEVLKRCLSSEQKTQDLEDLREHLQIPDNASNEVTLRLRSATEGNTECRVELPSACVTLVTDNVYVEVTPRWVPFLMIPMSTSQKA
ncbi:hypothetical protein T440DRAFT_473411 [Plenodomus tracheiphilus IPT5]|uniref:Uncharacterized protein n=1 Tax=Plenodomus tracheiphilus IPT5 TaxID=1408161 RepID=A0A6A7AQH4_9PLEO|nr:hypothetical protein T440DRAFT_473411 [Plenodomus tracheiphilus IPT5]